MTSSPQIIEGQLNAKGFKFAIVASRFNHLFVERLVQGALKALSLHGAQMEGQTLLWVPGALEIPVAALQLAQSKQYQAIITLGAVIRGDTDHYDFVVGALQKGISQVALQENVPVICNVLTVDTQEQAFERSGGKHGNLGYNAAVSAIEMASVFQQISQTHATHPHPPTFSHSDDINVCQ